jgi:hypothetical protein
MLLFPFWLPFLHPCESKRSRKNIEVKEEQADSIAYGMLHLCWMVKAN